MDRGFFIYVEDGSILEQPLPSWYNTLTGLDGYPIGPVFLITEEGGMFSVVVKPSAKGYCLSNGWSTVVNVLDIKDEDFIVFENVDAQTFRITHFKSYQDIVVGLKFHIVMLCPENKNLWLPWNFMEHYFNGDNLDDDFIIQFGDNHMWTVTISTLWEINYYVVDFSVVPTDLSLVAGDLIVFELVGDHVFRIVLFRRNGLQSLIPDLALPAVVKDDDDGFILKRGFYIVISDLAKGEQALPPWYNKLNDLKGYPIGPVVLTNDQAAEWIVVVKPTTTGYCLSNCCDQLSEVNNKFCHVMLFLQNKNLWLPRSFMERYFNTDTLDIEFTICFGSHNLWSVKVDRLWGSNYFIVDFSQISNDLHLIAGDFIMFELVANHLFNILLFRHHGFQSVIPEVALSVTIDEQEHSGDMDLIEDDQVAKEGEHLDTVDVVFEAEHLDSDQVANEYVLDHDVANFLPNVPVVEAEAVLEQELLDDIPIPPIVAQPDEYELTWRLTCCFRFPKAFATNVDLSLLNEMTVETEDGFSMTLEMRKETARGRIRYALRGWENFMLEAGLENGGQFVLRYARNLNRFSSEPEMVGLCHLALSAIVGV